MPRLRVVERTKYRFDSEELELLDSEDQQLVVDKFKARLGGHTPRRWVLRGTQMFILALGSLFVVHPHFRRGFNGVVSTLACFVLWAQVGQLYSVCNLSDKMSASIHDMYRSVTLKRLARVVYLYGAVVAVKWWWWSWSLLDWAYLVPGLLGFLIVDQERAKRSLLSDINKLDSLKYDFKQA